MNKKTRFTGTLLKTIILIANLIAVILLLLSYLAYYIPPKSSIIITFLGLGLPYLILLNICFIITWIFISYPYAFISLVALLIGIERIDSLYQFRGEEKPEHLKKGINVMSFNARLFGAFASNRQEMLQERNDIFRYLEKEQPDIICFQEYFDDYSKQYLPISDSIQSILKIKPENVYSYLPVNHRKKYYYGLSIYSKYRIINTGVIPYKKSPTNAAIYVDIIAFKDTIRIYNLHLMSFFLGHEDYQTGEKILTEDLDNPELQNSIRKMITKFKIAFVNRGDQVDTIRLSIQNSPYPVIVCGDFNDSPTSYAYHQISKDLKDSFRESGSGLDATYNGKTFPSFRIDYILHNSNFKSYQHTVDNSLKASDHYPIHSWILIK